MAQPNESKPRRTMESRPWLVVVSLGVLLVFVMPGVAAWVKYSKPRPRFHLTLTPSSNRAYPGWAETWQVKVTPTGGYRGTIRFATSGLPASVKAVFTNSVQITNGKPKTTTLIIDTSSVGADGSRNHEASGCWRQRQVPVSRAGQVRAGSSSSSRSPATYYTLGIKARTGSTVPAKGKKPGTIQFEVRVDRSGKNDTIKFAVPTNLPAGIKASFRPQSASGNETVLTFSNSNKKPVARWPFTVSGTSGSYNASTSTSGGTLAADLRDAALRGREARRRHRLLPGRRANRGRERERLSLGQLDAGDSCRRHQPGGGR